MERIESPKITFRYKDKDWCLEVTASTLEKMERMGVKWNEIDDYYVTGRETLFNGTFLEHHPSTSNNLKKEIYNALKKAPTNGTESLDAAIQNMYLSVIAELANRGDEGEIEWTMTGC